MDLNDGEKLYNLNNRYVNELYILILNYILFLRYKLGFLFFLLLVEL